MINFWLFVEWPWELRANAAQLYVWMNYYATYMNIPLLHQIVLILTSGKRCCAVPHSAVGNSNPDPDLIAINMVYEFEKSIKSVR